MLTITLKKSDALRNLVKPRLARRAFGLHPHLARARENLPRDQEGQHVADHPFPRHVAVHQVIVVATVAVADEIRVVLVKPDLAAIGRELLVASPGALGHDPFARLVLRDQLAQGRAFRRRIFGVRVVVVVPRAVAQYEVALDLLETQRPVLVDLEIGGFVRILEQFGGAKTPRVAVRILQPVIPLHQRAVLGVTPHEFNRFADNVHVVLTIHRDAVFGFDPKNAFHLSVGR